MIGKLKGIVDEVAEGHILLDVQGVGYVVFVSGKLLHTLPEPGKPLTLFIETQMREDAIRLFGFLSRAEQEWFRLLQNVQGVGAKLALAVLGSLTPDELAHALALRDIVLICRAPGMGKKLAERLINELKNKAPAALTIGNAAPAEQKDGIAPGRSSAALDAISALSNLGYSRDEAGRAVADAAKQAQKADTAELIRLGLQILAKK